MNVNIVDDGPLVLPKSLLNKLGIEDFEVITENHEILIRPKTNIRRYLGFAREGEFDKELIEQLEDSYLERGNFD